MIKLDPKRHKIYFQILFPNAECVELISDLNHWKRKRMKKVKGDFWEAKLDVSEGEHQFRYLVNGRTWMNDPTLPVDIYGSDNSIIYVNFGNHSN